MPDLINLKVLIPFQVFAVVTEVLEVIAESLEGSFGLLPHRRDCVVPLAPGILTYKTGNGSETYVAVDQGVLTKAGLDVVVSVRRAVAGAELADLRSSIQKEFVSIDEGQRSVRDSSARLEAAFMHRFAMSQHD